VTILVAPLMSCSARLPVYLLMIAALLPGDRVPLAPRSASWCSCTRSAPSAPSASRGSSSARCSRASLPLMIMELPPYRLPRLKDVAAAHGRARGPVPEARRHRHPRRSASCSGSSRPTRRRPRGRRDTQQLAHSFAGRAGHAIEPLIKPIGFDWQIGIGLISSFAAREVFVSTMGSSSTWRLRRREHDAAAHALRNARWPDGRLLFTPLVCLTAHDLLCLCDAVHEHDRRRAPRDQLLALADLPNRLHDWRRLDLSFIVYQSGTALGF
jgi:ferrous iron transport protein B